jgi:hypothetical protein
MFPLTRIVHVLAVGLWFGAGLFFTFVVGLSLFDTFERLTAKPAADRPFWLPVPSELEKSRPSERFPEPLRKEQGSRIAGVGVGPMFLPYYGLQIACGVLGLLTALAWFGAAGGGHKLRVAVLLLALGGAGAGWWLDEQVEALREKRGQASDIVLKSDAPSAEQVSAANEARANFGTWHTYSLFANFGTLGLVTVAMGMAAFLPAKPRE